jgi:hypothetical protein
MASRDGQVGQQRGAELEHRVARLEFADGSFVRLRHPVYTQALGSNRQITDIDVLSIEFDGRLRARITITECKSSSGLKNEQDRLLWLSGLRRLTNATAATLIREAVSAEGRSLARRLGLEIISLKEVDAREAVIAEYPRYFGHIGSETYRRFQHASDTQLKAVGDLPSGLVRFLRTDALVAQPYEVLGALLTLDEILDSATVLPQPLLRSIAYDSFMALVLSAIRVGAQLDILGETEVQRELETALQTGSPNDQQILRVADMADILLQQEIAERDRLYRAHGAADAERPMPSIRELLSQSPNWMPRFVDLATRFRRRSIVARDLPRTIEIACFEELIAGPAAGAVAFNSLFGIEHKQLLSVAVDCYARVLPKLASQVDGLLALSFERTPTDTGRLQGLGARSGESTDPPQAN